MTENQRFVLAHMDARNIGAIYCDGKYQFPINVMSSPTLADKIAEVLKIGKQPGWLSKDY